MAKRKRKTTKKQIEKRKKEGRGKGRFGEYIPWIKIQDLGSKGLSSRILGWKTDRIHHLLSKLELKYFYLLEWSPNVIDIREQFPLNQEETIAIAKELGIKHPTDPETKEFIVMTTDFLVTLKQNIGTCEKARTLKYAKSLRNKRTLEKFEIERVYWQNRNIDWAIVTERDINSTVVKNIELLHGLRDKKNLPPEINAKMIMAINSIIVQHYNEELTSLSEIQKHCSTQLDIPQKMILTALYFLLANKILEFDILKALNPRRKITLFNSTKGGKI